MKENEFFVRKEISDTLKDLKTLALYMYLRAMKIDTIAFEGLISKHFGEHNREDVGKALRDLIECKLVTYCQEEHFITVLDGSDYVEPK
jgi:hypothetical protein